MKTLHAKKALAFGLVLLTAPAILFILFGAYSFWEGEIDYSVFYMIISIICILVAVFLGLSIYCTHWLKYGDGKVVIRQDVKISGYGPIGCWANDEDEFLVKDIEAYGLSADVLPHSVEYHRSSSSRMEVECFFRLKNGEMIGYEIKYYMKKDLEAFYRYIEAETGLKFLINEKRLVGKRKHLRQRTQGDK